MWRRPEQAHLDKIHSVRLQRSFITGIKGRIIQSEQKRFSRQAQPQAVLALASVNKRKEDMSQGISRNVGFRIKTLDGSPQLHQDFYSFKCNNQKANEKISLPLSSITSLVIKNVGSKRPAF